MNLSRLRNIIIMALTSSSIASCSMMEEDLTDCPDGLDVYFKYDYNIQRADMFADHVGAVTVYVFDENNRFVMQRSVANTGSATPLKQHGYAMHFSGNELPAGRYSLLALAGQKSYEEMLRTEGAKFRPAELVPGDDISKLMVTLDRGETSAENIAAVENGNMPLDTLWHGLNVRTVEIRPDRTVNGIIAAVKDTISLTRDTKQLNITLRQSESEGEMLADNYDVRIIDRNGLLAYDNMPVETDTKLIYTPYAQWETGADEDIVGSAPGAVGLQAAHYELFTSRIMYHENAREKDARLIITNKTNGETVVDINLPYYLSHDRDQFSIYRYTAQEFLDREYKYNMSFFLVGDKWQYMIFSIGILDYSVRYQNVDL